MKLRAVLFVGVAMLAFAGTAQARPADCTLAINGVVYISGNCDFTQFGGDGSFQIRSYDGRYFAQVSLAPKGSAQGYWNGDAYAKKASYPLGQLRRSEGCWINEYAAICAY